MQDVTDLPFLRTIASFGGADLYVTEYFRVHIHSRLDPYILRSITENPTGRPVVAQMIGNSIPDLVRTARELQQHPIAAPPQQPGTLRVTSYAAVNTPMEQAGPTTLGLSMPPPPKNGTF